MRFLLMIACCLVLLPLAAQQPAAKDSSAQLEEVTVTAFHASARWLAVPAAVATISKTDIMGFSPVSLVPVLNMVPGVRMEERSPASYRLSIRGSLLRSPFGVRNVKVYWNDFPLTDGGGNTYLNLVDMNQIGGAEILKGPAASVYGAGTGGVLLLHSNDAYTAGKHQQFDIGITGGSYGLLQQRAGWLYSNRSFTSSLQQTHTQSDGYRQQSASRKDVLQWNGALRFGQQQLKFLFFYSDLYYQTPGGITLTQMQQDPQLARQPAGALPGSVQQKTAVYNKTIFGGLKYETKLNGTWDFQGFITMNDTRFRNPFITNYEKRTEDNIGTGFHFVFHRDKGRQAFRWISGAEWLYNRSAIDDYGNKNGQIDTVQFKDKVYATQWFAFTQAVYRFNNNWDITAGLSLNNQTYRFRRLTDPGSTYYQHRNINAVLTPRLAVAYKVQKAVTVYAVAAKGFSPPSLAELRPSDGNYYGDLQAEQGWNFELGVKGILLHGRLQFDVAAYHFKLKDAIVRRNNTAGAEYFVNAGEATQQGIEAFLKYKVISTGHGFLNNMYWWSSYSYQPYRFDQYKQGVTDYSGNKLTGVPRNIWVNGISIEARNGWYTNLSLNATASLPLTDANDAFANAYQLVQWKLGCQWKRTKQIIHFFTGIDNLLNQVYSLGNDINAAGKRYYNPAPARNFFAGVHYTF